MNHDAKNTGGIFRRRPSSASTSSRLSVQSRSNSGTISCPTSPRHQKQLPPTASSTSLNSVLNPTTSYNINNTECSRLHRSSSNYSNYNKQRSGYYAYTS